MAEKATILIRESFPPETPGMPLRTLLEYNEENDTTYYVRRWGDNVLAYQPLRDAVAKHGIGILHPEKRDIYEKET